MPGISPSEQNPGEAVTYVGEMQFTEGSGNVFADLGLEDAEELYLRAEMANAIRQTIKQRSLTQKKAAELMGESEADLSRMVNGRAHRYSIERLQRNLMALGKTLELTIRDADDITKPGHMLIRTA